MSKFTLNFLCIARYYLRGDVVFAFESTVLTIRSIYF